MKKCYVFDNYFDFRKFVNKKVGYDKYQFFNHKKDWTQDKHYAIILDGEFYSYCRINKERCDDRCRISCVYYTKEIQMIYMGRKSKLERLLR